MTNEFKHGSVGSELTQAEWEAIGAHVFDSQSTGDILYASSATQNSRLGIASTNNLLTISGGIPAWTATPTVTSLTTTNLTTSSFVLGTSSSPVTVRQMIRYSWVFTFNLQVVVLMVCVLN